MTATDAPSSSDTSASTKQQAQEAASTARDEGQRVAGVAKEQASQVASEAASQAKNVVGDAVSQVSDQLREQGGAQRDKLVSTLSSLGDDLSAMADQGSPGLANDLTRQVAERAQALTSRLDGREAEELLGDVRRFARQRPGLFLAGSLVAGVVVGRLLAGTRDGIAGAAAAESSSNTGGGAPAATETFTSSPSLGVSTPGQPTQEADYTTGTAPAEGAGAPFGEGRP